jgi:predicted phosphodiesterase
LALWSDWHIGEVVFREQVAGINEYNTEIARRRVRTLVEKIIHLCFHHTVNPTYPGIVVCLGGDMISGIIHEELRETNDATVMQQLREVYRLLASSLATLADAFGHVWVVGVVGNHGRSTYKPRAKNRVQDSFEYTLYGFLEDRFLNDKRFDFYIPEHTDAIFTIAGHRFLLTHGDSTGAKGGDGQIGAIGPIIRGEKRVRDVQSLVGEAQSITLMGHYHMKVSLDNVIVNPTLKGYDEYAMNMLRARPERPAQMLLFVHDDGIIDERRIFVEPAKKRAGGLTVSLAA